MPTVVHYVDSETFGGTERILVTLLGCLRQHGWRPVLAPSGATDSDAATPRPAHPEITRAWPDWSPNSAWLG